MREFLDSLLDFSPMLLPFLRLLVIFVLGLWTLRLVDSALKKIAQIVPADEAHRARINHRALTLRHFVRSFGKAVLGVLIVILLTSELGLNLAPLLAGAGIAGLAIGFGAQSLVKD